MTNKTIKEFADELGISKSKVHYQVSKLNSDQIVILNGIKYLTNAVQKEIAKNLGVEKTVELDKDESIQIVTSEKELKGENYQIAIKKLEDMGFKNIKVEKVNDLKIGIFSKEGDVKEVTINGENDFEKDTYFDKNSKIKIYYHVFDK